MCHSNSHDLKEKGKRKEVQVGAINMPELLHLSNLYKLKNFSCPRIEKRFKENIYFQRTLSEKCNKLELKEKNVEKAKMKRFTSKTLVHK